MVFNEYDRSRPLLRTNHRVGCHPEQKFDDIHLGGGSIFFRFPPTGRFRKDFRLIDTNRRLLVTHKSCIMSTESHLDVSPLINHPLAINSIQTEPHSIGSTQPAFSGSEIGNDVVRISLGTLTFTATGRPEREMTSGFSFGPEAADRRRKWWHISDRPVRREKKFRRGSSLNSFA
jgi:hypothetical protein